MKTIPLSSLFEPFFVLWLFSYQFKNAHSLFQSPDITILLTLLLIPWAWRIGRRYGLTMQSFLDPTLVLFLLFSAWCVGSVFWSPSHFYARSKALCYVFYIIPAFLMAYFIVARNAKNLMRLLQMVCVFSLLTHLYVFYVFGSEGVHIIDILNTNYLRTGQTIGIGFLILFIYSLYMSPNISSRAHPASPILYWGSLILCGTLFYIALNLGGRGPVIAMGFTIFLIYIMLLRDEGAHRLVKHFVTLSLVLGGVYILCQMTLMATTPAFLSRMHEALNTTIPDKNITLRLDFYHSAFQTFLHHPLIGVGLGGWPVVFGYEDILWHPHNLFLELLAETGGIGFLGFCALLWQMFRRLSLKHIFQNQICATLLALFIFSFMNAMKSGDLIDNIFLFVCLGILARLPDVSFSRKDSLLGRL